MSIKKIILYIFAVLTLFFIALFLFRDFFLRQSGNFFLLPYSLHLKKVETHLSGWGNVSFTTEGSFKKAPYSAEGILQLLPPRIDFQKIQINHLPATAIDKKIVIQCGFTIIHGTADIRAKGWAKTTQVDMDASVALFDAKIVEAKKTFLNIKEKAINFLAKNGKVLRAEVHLSGNPFNPNVTCGH